MEPMTLEQLPKTIKNIESKAELAASDHNLQIGVLNDTRDMVGALSIAVTGIFLLLIVNLVGIVYIVNKLEK